MRSTSLTAGCRWALSAVAAAVLSLGGAAAYAQQANTFDSLLEKLKDKGVLSDDEYQSLKQARDEEIQEQRAARRAAALKQAQDNEQKEKQQEAAAKAPKFDMNPDIRSMQLFGDIRLRYESRSGDQDAGTRTASGGLSAAGGQTVDRWRYAVRIGLRGDLTDKWYYGLRLETNSNPRSTWVTFGGETQTGTNGTNKVPFAKDQDTIAVGWAYMGYKPTGWLDVTAGKMPNPMFTIRAGGMGMVWDPDINPEGLSEKLSFALNDRWTLFGNFGQFVYADVGTDSTRNNLGFSSEDGYLLAWQAGVNWKFAADSAAKLGVTWYNYQGNLPTSTVTTVPQTLGGPFSGQPGGNQIGINNLSILDVPFELTFPLFHLPWTFSADWTMNMDSSARAAAAGQGAYGNQNKAWLVGLKAGGLKKKGDWEAGLYYAHMEQFALDPNLVDSDFFDARLNMQGWWVAGSYNITNAIFTTLRYGQATRINSTLGTGGTPDSLAALNPLDNYKLLQVDLGFRF